MNHGGRFGAPTIGVLATLLAACAACIWLAWAELGGLRFDPSTEALIDPADLGPATVQRDELMILLSADTALSPTHLAQVDRVTSILEQQADGAKIRSLTNIQIPVSFDDSVELMSIGGWLDDPDAQARVALDTLLTHPLLRGRLVSADRHAAGIHITLDAASAAPPERARALVDLARAAMSDTDLTLAATGGPLVSHAISSSLQQQLQQVLPLLALAFVLVLLIAFRCIRLVLVAVVSIALSVIAALTALAAIGGTLNLVTTLIVPLVATLTVAYQMHLLSATEHHDDATRGAQTIALPLMVTALTTAVGLLALAVHPTPAIRSFALASALGVAASALVTRYWSPAAMDMLGACPRAGRPLDRILDALTTRLARWNARFGRWVLRFAVFCLLVGVLGALRLQTEANLVDDLPDHDIVRQDYATVTEALWSTTGFSVLVRTSTPGAVLQPDLLQALARLQDWLAEQPEIQGSYGLTNILEELNIRFGDAPRDAALPTNPTLAKQLIIAAAPDDVYDYTNLQFSETRVHVGTPVQNTREITELVERVEQRLQSFPPGLDIQLTGNAVTFARTVNKLTSGQAFSFLAAFAAIFAILSIVFASVRAAAFAMLPNLVPVALFFGLIGWSGLPLGPTTALVACIVLGIAVDDTLHYLVRFNHHARERANAREATRLALRDVIRPVTLTTLATCIGFLTLTVSPFHSQVLFGWLAASTLAIAWLCDLTVAPVVGLRADVVTLWDVLRVDLGEAPQKSIPLLADMSPRQARVFALLSNLRTIPAGTRFIREGDLARDIYVIVEGTARVWVDSQGEEVDINRVGRGTTLGETGYFSTRRTANVTALTDLRVLDFDTDDLERLRRRHPRVASLVYRNLNSIQAERLARATRQIAEHPRDEPVRGPAH